MNRKKTDRLIEELKENFRKSENDKAILLEGNNFKSKHEQESKDTIDSVSNSRCKFRNNRMKVASMKSLYQIREERPYRQLTEQDDSSETSLTRKNEIMHLSILLLI